MLCAWRLRVSGDRLRSRRDVIIFGFLVSILGLIPLSMNQFAIDKAGFTRYMLSPFGVDDLVLGKAVGNALIAAGPMLFCFVLPALILPGGAWHSGSPSPSR